eukprot:TRINITY_DN1147_c0_g1_i1.p1 TRINITY_DN1147_c0_g1~~TRINITY_DN1147_c0_g1_i1.p1  ORF type:complete len:337 (+),score=83.74 TRINITY_DN1147_c0_g1_i1:105-1013(+)
MAQIDRFLDTHTIGSIHRTTALVTLDPDDTIEYAFQTLASSTVTAAAVYDKISKQFLGFVDTLDLTVFTIRVFAENLEHHPHLYDPKELAIRFNRPVSDVINASKTDIFSPVESTKSIQSLISDFLQFGVHRVPVLQNGQVIGIVSQSDVVRYLLQHANKMEALFNKKLSELSMDKGPVVTITNDQSLMKAFTQLMIHNISGLAVVDLNGQLVNNLSASDLKGITTSTFYKLEGPIHEVFMSNPNKLPPVTCSPRDSIGDVIRIVVKTGVHRVFVVDEQYKPVNVITLTDIIRLFAQPYQCL